MLKYLISDFIIFAMFTARDIKMGHSFFRTISEVIFSGWNQWASVLNYISLLDYMTNSKHNTSTSTRLATTKHGRVVT